MKSKYNRLSRLNHIVLAVAATGALMSSAHATTYTWVQVGLAPPNPPGTTYNPDPWNSANNATNWDANGVPTNDGTADVVFTMCHQGWPNYQLNPNSLPGNPNIWAINSLTFINSGTQADWDAAYIFGNNAAATLSIGAGGIVQNMFTTPYIGVPIIATASQAWNINNMSGNYTGGIEFGGNLTLNDGVLITKNNNSAANVLPPVPTGGSAWWAGALHLPTTVTFDGGVTTTIGSGAFCLAGGGFVFNTASQYGRLGTNPLIVTMDPLIRNDVGMTFCDTGVQTFATPVAVSGGYGSVFNIVYGNGPNNGTTDAGTTLTLTGILSGDMRGGGSNDRGMFNIQCRNIPYNNDDRNRLIIQGNNSGLTSQNPGTWGLGIIHIPQGAVVLDNANAMGAGNSLSIFVGNNANSTTNNFAGLLATNGNNVSSHVYVRNVANGGNQHRISSEVGLSGPGSVTFSGDFQMDTTSWTVSQGPNGEGPNLARLKLTAPAGGQANFTGHLIDGYSGDPYFTTVTVLAGGTVKIAGDNAYRGKTTVRGGTLLLGAHNNALGQNTPAGAFTPTNVSLGGTVIAPAGGDVVAATTNGQLPVSGLAAGVLTLSSAVNSLDGVALIPGDRVLLKDIAWNPERSGVYTVTDSTHWARAADLNTASAFPEGLRIHVTYGTINGGQNFYLPTGLWNNAVIGDGGSGAFLFNPDAQSNENVAILTDDALAISRNIDVTNNLSTGQSILGGNSAVSSTFSGLVTLSKDLAVQAAASGTVTFSGDITGSNNVVAQGSGLVQFSTSKSYTGTTNVTSGTLEVDSTLASSGVTVGSGGILQGTGTLSGTLSASGTGVVSPGLVAGDTMHAGATAISGHLEVKVDGSSNTELISTGAIDMSGGTVDVTVGGGGFTQPYYVIAQGSSVTGTVPSATAGYQVQKVGNQLQLSVAATNTFGNWMSSNYPGLTGANALPGADPDHDGLTNLMEYALNLNPTVSSLPPGTRTGSTLTFTKGAMAKVDTNIEYSIEESTNLVTWGAPTLGTSVNGADTITYTFPSGQTKVFARLKVVQSP